MYNKSILLSVQPYWVFLIIAKKMGWNIDKVKTIEARKNFPKDKDWNKLVEIYCSKNKKSFNRIPKKYQPLMEKFLGKVVGSFTCNKIEDFSKWEFDYPSLLRHINLFAGTNGDYKFLDGYLKGKNGYGWHISDLKIYGKPRELNEFKKENKCYKKGDLDNIGCWERGCLIQEQGWCDGRFSRLTRPPQSWFYVEIGE